MLVESLLSYFQKGSIGKPVTHGTTGAIAGMILVFARDP
jgi:hypothetical protein